MWLMGLPPTNDIQDPARSYVKSEWIDSTDLFVDVLVEDLVHLSAPPCFGALVIRVTRLLH
jgi:hypothetical protein